MADTQATIMLKVNVNELAKLKQVAKELDNIKQKAAGFDAATTKMKQVEQASQSLSAQQGKLTNEIKKTTSAVNDMNRRALSSYTSLGQQASDVTSKFSMATRNARTWIAQTSDRLSEATKHMLGFGKNIQWTGRQLIVGFTLPITLASRAAIKAAMDIEAEWVRVRKVYGDTAEEAASFAQVQKDLLQPTVERLSDVFAQHQKDIVQIMGDWAAMGFTGERLAGIVKETLGFMTAGDIEAAEATEYLRSVVSIFNLTVDETHTALAQLNAIENATAATMRDLGEGLARVGETARIAGLSVAETGALIAQMRDAGVTASTAGQALKTMISRLYAPTKEANDIIQEASNEILGYTINLRSAGFQTLDFKGRMKEIGKIYDELERKTANGTEEQKNWADSVKIQVAEALTGIRQFSRFETVMEGINDELSAHQRALDAALNPDVVARYHDEIKEVLESAPKMWDRLRVSIENLGASWGKIVSENLMPLVRWLIGLTHVLKSLDPAVVRKIFLFGALLAIMGPVLAYIGFIAQAAAILGRVLIFLGTAIGLNTGLVLVYLGALLALYAAFKLNIGGFRDWVNSMIKSIKSVAFNIGSIGDIFDDLKTNTKMMQDVGKAAVDEFGDGVQEGVANAANNAALRASMEQFGASLTTNFLRGFGDIDMDILSEATSIIQSHFDDMLSMEQISADEAVSGIQKAVETVAEAIANSNATGKMISVFDKLKSQVGQFNAEIIEGLATNRMKVGIIEEELELRKKEFEAAQDELQAQKDYVSFLQKSNKDISIEIATTEKQRMFEIQAKVKVIQKANLEEIQAEKRKMLMLAKQAKDKKDAVTQKEDELKAAKDLLKVEQQIAQLRLGFLRSAGAKGETANAISAMPSGIPDINGITADAIGSLSDLGQIAEVQDITGNINQNFEELGEGLKKLGKIAAAVGTALLGGALFTWFKNLATKFPMIAGLLDKLKTKYVSLLNFLKINPLQLGLVGAAAGGAALIIQDQANKLEGEIDAALESTMAAMDKLNEAGKQKESMDLGLQFSQSQSDIDQGLAQVETFFQGVKDIAFSTFSPTKWKEFFDETIFSLPQNLATMVQQFGSIFENLGQQVGQSLKKAMLEAGDGINIWMNEMKQNWSDFWHGIGDALVEKWARIKEIVSTGFMNIVEWFGKLPGMVVGAIAKFGETIWGVFDKALEFLTGKLPDMVNKLAAFFFNLPDKIKDATFHVGGKMWESFETAKTWLKDRMFTMMDDIANWWRSLPDKIRDAVKGVGSSIGQGIGNLIDKVKQGANNLVSRQTGGLVPGGFSQAVPIMAHGREMVLNKSQQLNLFKMLAGRVSGLEGRPMAAAGAGMNVNYNVQINAGMLVASPGEQRALARSLQTAVAQEHRRTGPQL